MNELLAVVDDLNQVRQFVECAWMASQALEPEEVEPLAAVLDLASEKLADIAKAVATIKMREDRSKEKRAS